MTRLFSLIIILSSMLFASCNKKPDFIDDDGVSLTFSTSFLLAEEVKSGGAVTAEVLDTYAQLIGSRGRYSSDASNMEDCNDFTTIYQYMNQSSGNLGIITEGGKLDQMVHFEDGNGSLTTMVNLPSEGAPIYVRAFAPVISDVLGFKAPIREDNNTVIFSELTGKVDVLLTKACSFGSLPDQIVQVRGEGEGNKSAPNIELNFEHKLSKISFQFLAENTEAQTLWGNILKIELIAYPNNITLYLDRGATLVAGNEVPNGSSDPDYTIDESKVADIVVCDYTGDEGVGLVLTGVNPVPAKADVQFALVPPSVVESDSHLTTWGLRITTSTGAVELAPAPHIDNVLRPGKHHNYVITFSSNVIDAIFDVSVAEWNKHTSTDGDGTTIPVI